MNDRKQLNQQAWDNPQVGDYWHEMFCPYFLIVDIQGDAYTVLCTINDPDTQNAKIDGVDSWEFDYSKYSVVTKDWIQRKVKYISIDGFVADVVRNKSFGAVLEWREANPDYTPVVQKPINQDIWFRGV